MNWKMASLFLRPFLPSLLTIFITNLCLLFGSCSDQKRPLPAVILPSVFRWETTNRIFVTPNLNGAESVDVSVRVQSENEKGEKNEFFNEKQKGTRAANAFKVFVPKSDPSGALLENFYVKIDVSGHRQFASVLAGTSDLRQMFIQTDKVFYRPGERVNVRALPLASGGTPYKGNVQFNLLDPNGFRIFNKTSRTKAEETVDKGGHAETEKKERVEGFLAQHFELPKFLRFGKWKITAFAVEHNGQKELVTSDHFEKSIHVREYVVPKFHVVLSIEETLRALSVKGVVSARFAHGMPVTGELTFRCSSADSANISSDSFGGDQTPAFSASSLKKLLSTEIVAGLWSGNLDLSNCLGPLKSSTRIRIIAEVFERGTLQSVTAQRHFDPFWPAFELLPLRPAFTENTTKLLLYLRPLSSLPFVLNGRAEVVARCISEDKALNGLNQSSFHKLGTLVELETNRGCVVYIIRARRQLPNGNFSTAESVVIPALTGGGAKSLDFSLIGDQSPQNRVDYVEGEVMDVRLNSDNGLNYALTCDGGRDLVAMEPIGEDRRILVPITARMRPGPCVLYVFGKGAEANVPRGFVVDMRLFFIRTEQCPDQQYSVALSSHNVSVGAPLGVLLRARPNSLALLHAYDSRLDGLLSDNGDSSRIDQRWSFTEFLSPEPGEQNDESFSLFSNLVDVPGILARRKEICRLAGKLNPQCPLVTQTPNGRLERMSSRISEDCYREMKEQCERQHSTKGPAETLTERPLGGSAPAEESVKTAGNVQWLIRRPPLKTTPNDGMEDVKALRMAGRGGEQQKKGEEGTEIGLRDFFPEVWLFNDFSVGMDGSKELRLNSTPHSVTEWLFLASFWSSGRSAICHSPKQSLVTQKNVFMDVEVPLHVYVNESVNVHIAVSAANLTENRPMSVCFHGLSPKVCGDVGREGTFGETDFTRVLLTPENPVQLKNFFVRFLRHGTHNLSFELRSEDVMKGHDWHCRDRETKVYDRIVKQVQVKRRVDVEEHFRQIVVYRRKRAEAEDDESAEGQGPGAPGAEAPGDQLTLDQILDLDNPTTTAAHSLRSSLLISSPDVISYSMLQPFWPDRNDRQRGNTVAAEAVQTKVLINAGGRKIYNLGVEFSKFVPSFPPALSTELLSVASPFDSRGSAALQRVRNRPPLGTFGGQEGGGRAVRSSETADPTKENRLKRRGKISDPTERPLQGYSLPNLLKELALLTYELKSLRTMMTLGVGDGERAEDAEEPTRRIEWTERREQLLGNLLAELLTFSDCEFRLRECAFGEFGRPKEQSERSLILTTLATSLLCEQKAAEEFVCGPIAFLAREVRTVLNGTDGGKGTETQFDPMGGGVHVQFNDPAEQRLFLETLFVQTVLDCSAYACAASPFAKESWKRLHSSFYRSVDLDKRYDVRVVAALAYMSTAATRSIMRSRLATSTLRDDKAPFWGFVNGAERKGPTDRFLEQSLQRSSNVLANALALLAYTREHSVYRYWKNEFDFEALSNWLVEQQNSRRQYENALDTFFASRALFQFASANVARHVRLALLGSVQGNLSIPSSPPLSRQFTDNELPFSLSVTPSANRMQIETKGDARLLLGVRVLMEKRRRSRREPSDGDPVTLDLVQSRTQSNFIQQTVTVLTRSQLIRSVQIEHGIFTGFSSRPHLVQILNSSVHFQAGPRVSLAAVHFVLSNLTKEEAVVYTVTLIEPENPYSPTDLAPIAIAANYHHLTLGQLIALPDNLDFGTASGEVDSLDSLLKRATRRRRSKKHRRSRGHHTEEQQKRVEEFEGEANQQNGQLVSSAKSFLTRIQSAQSSVPPTPRHSFMQMMVLDRSRQPSPDVIETVCLPNGVCTCAETTCTLRCSSCARLTFQEICHNIYSHGHMQKFALTFRLNPNSAPQTVKIAHSSAEYTVLENVRVVEWQSSSLDRPELLTVWIRKCNVACLNMLKETNGKSPRFMLIGTPQGLFDEGEFAAADLDGHGESTVSGWAAEDRMVRTHYVMYDNDRLLRSTDCHELFGRVADESCEGNGQTKANRRWLK